MSKENTLYNQFVAAHPEHTFQDVDYGKLSHLQTMEHNAREYAARNKFMEFSKGKINELMAAKNYEGASHATDEMIKKTAGNSPFSKMMDALSVQNTTSATAHTVEDSLTQGVKATRGVSAGKVTAVIAGIGILAAAAYALRPNKKEDAPIQNEQTQQASWADRVRQSQSYGGYRGH